MNTDTGHEPQKVGPITIGLCFLVALLEGLDLQSTGVAAPRMSKELQLAVAQLGWAFSIGAFGLLPGAAIGGRLADRIGRKRVLVLSVAVFGIFSMVTTLAWDLHSLLAARFLTGLGLGAAMPNLIALCAEAATPKRRSAAVGAMYCGVPLGAAFAAAIGILSPGASEWRHIFYVGGLGPLLILPLLAVFLQETVDFRAQARMKDDVSATSVSTALWRGGRAATTIALWISYLGTLIVLYFLMNWLPSMVMNRGLSPMQAGQVQMLFNIGGSLGAVGIASLLDRIGRKPTVIGMYVGLAASLCVLAAATGSSSTAVGGLLAGMFLVGTQSALYALAGAAYPTHIRGTGVGAAIAVGRVGSIVGPLIAGQLLALGQSPTMLVMASIPVIAIAAISALMLLSNFSRGSMQPSRAFNSKSI
ncbi:3-(3-hydroxy-phenyl)propionate transporter MhpT [Herbaspirillum sp. NPDC087042]|uniref:3-(3-hydroxy-phenyl)propionate transporter MhpT n=1 Tax=Herbaspirillum sp. NPDC087042 TaxID=3364004 RepID=UPI0037F5A37A